MSSRNKDHPLTILPQLRLVRDSDFATKSGQLGFPKHFYVHSFHREVLEEHNRNSSDTVEKWKPWLDENRVYVLKEKPLEIDLPGDF